MGPTSGFITKRASTKEKPPAMFFNLHITQKNIPQNRTCQANQIFLHVPSKSMFSRNLFLSITGRLRAGSNQKGTRISVYFKSLAFALKTYRSGSLWPTATPRLPAGSTPSKLSAKMQKKDQQQNLRLELSQRFAGH